MRWFKHMCQTRSDEKIAKFFDECGWEGYGVYWGILEIISNVMCKEKGWKTEVTYPLSRWVSMLSLHRTKLSKYLLCAEQQGLLLVSYSGDTLSVNCPNLLKYKDEYSRKSGQCPDTLRTMSGQTPRQDTDTNTNTKLKGEVVIEDNAATADFQHVKNYFLEQSPAFFRDLPTTLKFWSSPKLQGMLSAWTKEGVTLEDVQAAVTHQRAKDDFKPNPYYYADAVIDFARERKKFGKYRARGSPGKKTSTELNQEALERWEAKGDGEVGVC